jgi:hypothetical protein
MHRIANPVRIIGLLSVAVALSGCSAIKLGYNSAPTVAAWWLDGYMDFSDDQDLRVREDLNRLHQWHRRQELPRLNALLQQAERMVGSDVTADEVCAMAPSIRQRVVAIAGEAEPAVTTLALSLRPEQLAHLQRKYDKNNSEYRKDWIDLPAADLRDKQIKQYIERMEMMYGRLEEAQRELIRSQVERSAFSAPVNLRERQRRQQDVLQALRKLAGQPASLSEARATVHQVLERASRSPDPAYRSYEDALIRQGCRNLAAIHQSTTPQQRQNAVRRLRAYQRDLEDLQAQP